MRPFPRPDLANRLAAAMTGRDLAGDGPNGVFLAAPRRTGKTTFLLNDLLPVLEAQGIEVVYVDLWADTQRDPAVLIAEALAQAVRRHRGAVRKAADAVGLNKLTVAGALSMDLARLGQPDGPTLTDALRQLHRDARKPVALLIDEAQHALVSPAGEHAMAALKSARDQLNRPGTPTLMLVMTGSDRDKLLRLVHGHAAPFQGSQVLRMPLLDQSFVNHVALTIEAARPDLKPVDAASLAAAFALFGHRPQSLAAAIGQALNPLEAEPAPSERFEAAVLARARRQKHEDGQQLAAAFHALKPLERLVLWRMLQQGASFRPYDTEALAFYQQQAQAEGAEVKLTKPMVQNALESLRNRNPPWVWKSAKGEYAVDDVQMQQWYVELAAHDRWPPLAPPQPMA